MHPRACLSGLCFPALPALDALEAIAGLGVVSRAGLSPERETSR